jgi:hypothetical protein
MDDLVPVTATARSGRRDVRVPHRRHHASVATTTIASATVLAVFSATIPATRAVAPSTLAKLL